MKFVIYALVIAATSSAFAMGQNDYSTPIYGHKAKKIFSLIPKLRAHCAYLEAGSEDQGNLGAKVNAIINDKNINSVQCKLVGEDTYACEASTLEYVNPCEAKK